MRSCRPIWIFTPSTIAAVAAGVLPWPIEMNRRQAIKTGVAAVAAVPFLGAATWKPLLFTPQQNDTVVALTAPDYSRD